MKKIICFLILLFAVQSYAQQESTVFELTGSQSMCITGKGAGQDAAINPFKDKNSIAIVENIGKNELSVRVEYQGKLFLTRAIEAGKTAEISLRRGSILYVDADLKTSAKVSFKEGKE
ncbi:hypothetical protein [Kordia zhangzhouensis]|uniref:hypothetical protein n=1 Tax=Kordia zhangzhouensis TaxID=1620405 RepID=UPI00069C4865|nr:hypothetical protein [Kordia zhangzhouensis]